ncbi:MAG: STAS domain-containing protein [Actinobacteria bacterium]|nr:STAS domain-containing protein [Actinomycetota bacterium]
MELVIDKTTTDGALVIRVNGELDVYTAPQLKNALSEGASQGHHSLVIDLTCVGFLDSTALGVLVGGQKQMEAEAVRLSLVITDPNLAKIFRITGLDGLFEIYSSVSEAINRGQVAAD